jgi:RHH-type rel operon transcriptional repressor/antitoxin RelB
MAERCVLSVSTKPELRDRLDKLASATRRSKSFLANEAIERYLTSEEDFVNRIESRKAEMKQGAYISGDELLSRFENRMKKKFSSVQS